MAFQFLCPQGHLLQGDESQAGQQCMCPYCNSVFIVPPPMTAPAPEPEPTPPPNLLRTGTAPGRGAAEFAPLSQGDYLAPGFEQPAPTAPEPSLEFPGIRRFGDLTVGAGAPDAPTSVDLGAGGSPFVHIICPSGHELETPREMLGQDALCPYCQVQFRLRLESSLEYRKEKADEEELRMIRKGNAWLRWSIATAAMVLVGLIILIAYAATQ